MLEAPEVRFPIANLKVKIVLAISLCQGRLRSVLCGSWVLLRKSAEGLPDDNQAAYEKISPHILWGALILRFTSGSSRRRCSTISSGVYHSRLFFRLPRPSLIEGRIPAIGWTF